MSKFTSNNVVEEVVKDLLEEVVKVGRRKEEEKGSGKAEAVTREERGIIMVVLCYFKIS